MTRFFYTCLLHLHPPAFRRRFAEEMLWIFDQESGAANRVGLLADAFVSLGRQQFLRPEYRKDSRVATWRPVPSVDGVPTFYISGTSMPCASSLFNGLLLSVVAFGAVALFIAHGGGPSGFIQLPSVVVPSSNAPLPRKRTSIAVSRPRNTERAQPKSKAFEQIQRSIEQRWADQAGASTSKQFPTPASEQDRPLSRKGAETASLATNAATNGGGTAIAYRASSVDGVDAVAILFSELDDNEDGVITKAERNQETREKFQRLLDCADFDEDGELLLGELRDAVGMGEVGCADRTAK